MGSGDSSRSCETSSQDLRYRHFLLRAVSRGVRALRQLSPPFPSTQPEAVVNCGTVFFVTFYSVSPKWLLLPVQFSFLKVLVKDT